MNWQRYTFFSLCVGSTWYHTNWRTNHAWNSLGLCCKTKDLCYKGKQQIQYLFLCLLKCYWKSVFHIFICVFLCLLGVMCDPVSSCNRGRRGGLCLPVFLFQQQRSFWCGRQWQPFDQGFIPCPTQCKGINPIHTTTSWRTRCDNALTTTHSLYIMNVCIIGLGQEPILTPARLNSNSLYSGCISPNEQSFTFNNVTNHLL